MYYNNNVKIILSIYADGYNPKYKFGENDTIVTYMVLLSRRFAISHFGQLFVGKVYGTPNENIWTQ